MTAFFFLAMIWWILSDEKEEPWEPINPNYLDSSDDES